MEELIEKSRNGDKEAYTELIHLIEHDLYCIASIKLNNIEDINDVIQETMLKSFSNIKYLKDVKSFKPWIVKILLNECKKVYARKSKIKDIFEKLVGIQDVYKYNDDIKNIDGKIDFDLLIKKLKKDEQMIVTLYFLKNFSLNEISEILNMKYNTVKTKLRRTEEKICNIIEKEEGNG